MVVNWALVNDLLYIVVVLFESWSSPSLNIMQYLVEYFNQIATMLSVTKSRQIQMSKSFRVI